MTLTSTNGSLPSILDLLLSITLTLFLCSYIWTATSSYLTPHKIAGPTLNGFSCPHFFNIKSSGFEYGLSPNITPQSLAVNIPFLISYHGVVLCSGCGSFCKCLNCFLKYSNLSSDTTLQSEFL